MEDDFILTISDNESLSISDIDSEGSDTAPLKNNLGKRKRAPEPPKQSKKNSKKQKVTPLEPEESGSEEEEQGKQDGAIDPNFEFDVGGSAFTGVVEEFDGWEDQGGIQTKGNKKGVDIDEIIARRAERKAKNTSTRSKETKEDEFEGLDSDIEVEDGGSVDLDNLPSDEDMPNFDDDELLAEDAFGGAAESEEEAASAEEDSEDQETPQINADKESDTDSEAESVASPTAHPDDFASDHGDSDDDSQTSVSDPAEQAKRDAFFAPDTATKSTDVAKSGTGFSQFSLSRPLLRALASLNFTEPTPIQLRTIPLALQGLDLVASAVTGSGKTAAFLLPILERLLYRPRRIPTTRVAILLPTRELAVQCHSVAIALSRNTDITFAQLVGGFSLREQENLLKKRPDVVIATPGRFIDHMRNSASFSLSTLEILVLDEADRMLDDGFADELNEILRTIPRSRQTLLFSATMTESIDRLIRVGMTRPLRISVDAPKSTTTGLTQEFIRLRPGRDSTPIRLASLITLCKTLPQYTSRTIIFFRSKLLAHRTRILFSLLNLPATELHGSMSQDQRLASVTSFKNGTAAYLLATDLASRGLDIKNVAAVINYEAPQSHSIYVHRVGRTARAGRTGYACTLAAESDRKVVKAAVKAARAQSAKVVSRVLPADDIDKLASQISDTLDVEIDEILTEERSEKQLQAAEVQLTRGENLVKHEAEILARPKRTWFESEVEKRVARKQGRVELNGPEVNKKKKGKGGGKVSNTERQALDDRRERVEGGKLWRKGKGEKSAGGEEKRVGKMGRGMEDKGKGRKGKSGGIKKMKKGGKR
jgi:ATP-dependent RNA helicase DDX27